MEETKTSKRFSPANLPEYSDEELQEHFYKFAHRYTELANLARSFSSKAFDAANSEDIAGMYDSGNQRDSAKGLADQVHKSMMACQTEMTLRGLTADVSRMPAQPSPGRAPHQEHTAKNVVRRSETRSKVSEEEVSFKVPSVSQSVGWGWGLLSAFLLLFILTTVDGNPGNPPPDWLSGLWSGLGKWSLGMAFLIIGAVGKLVWDGKTGISPGDRVVLTRADISNYFMIGFIPVAIFFVGMALLDGPHTNMGFSPRELVELAVLATPCIGGFVIVHKFLKAAKQKEG